VLEVLADLDLDSLRNDASPNHAKELKQMLAQASPTKRASTGLRGVLSKFAAAGVLLVLILGSPFALNKRELQAADAATFNQMPRSSSLAMTEPIADTSDKQDRHSLRVVAQKQVDRP
jgi:hypothetical protein